MHKNSATIIEEDPAAEDFDPTIYFTPIAFVIETQVEHHSLFKEAMMQLYEHLYKPKAVSQNAQSNELLAFSDFIAHIAFLASLPSPTFNTLFEIDF